MLYVAQDNASSSHAARDSRKFGHPCSKLKGACKNVYSLTHISLTASPPEVYDPTGQIAFPSLDK